MNGPRRQHLLALLSLAILTAIAFSDVLSPERGLYFVDHLNVFRPRWQAIIDNLSRLELPLLTRASPGGVPIEAVMNGTYTPMTLLFFLGDFDVTYDLFVAAHVFLLAAGVYCFALELGASVVESVASAAVFALAGPVLSFENLLVGLQGLAWAPWVYLYLLKTLRAPSPGRAALLASFVGCHFQAMMPTTALLDVVVGLMLLARTRHQLEWRRLGTLAFCGVLGFMIASIHLMPVLEYLASTRRGAGFSYAEASTWSLHPGLLLEFITPAFWSAPEIPVIALPSLNDGQVDPYFNSLYFGCALFLFPCALFNHQYRRWVGVLLAVFALALAIAFGHRLPVHRLVTYLPLLNNDRYPVKYLTFLVAVVAALLPLALRAFQSNARVFLLGPLMHLVLLVAVYSVVVASEFTTWLGVNLSRDIPTPNYIGVEESSYPRLLVEAIKPRLLHSIVFVVLLLALVVYASFSNRQREGLITAVVAIIALDLAMAGRFAIFGAPVSPRPPEMVLNNISSRTDKLMRLAPGPMRARVAHREGHTFFEDYVVSDRVRGYGLDHGVRYFEDQDPDAQSNNISVALSSGLGGLAEPDALTLLARAGVAWVTSPLEHPVEGVIRWEVEGEAPHYAFPVPEFRPYVKVYSAWAEVQRERLTHPRELAQIFIQRDTKEVAMLPVKVLGTTGTSTAPSGPCAFKTEVPAQSRLENIRIQHRGDCRALVVVREVAMPNWFAFINGKPAPLLEVELGFLGVFVPPGEHVVEFRFIGRTLTWAWVSIAGVAVVLSFAAISLFRDLGPAHKLAGHRRSWLI